jgi:hypothetical protein
MLLYGFAINFVLTICLGLAFIQFLFYLFASKPNISIANFNKHLLEFFQDSLAFLLFETDNKPFPFKDTDDIETSQEGEVIEAEVEKESPEENDNASESEISSDKE